MSFITSECQNEVLANTQVATTSFGGRHHSQCSIYLSVIYQYTTFPLIYNNLIIFGLNTKIFITYNLYGKTTFAGSASIYLKCCCTPITIL